jgi:hypothetical protein
MGGTIITIKGSGFSNDKSLVQVLVSGEPCIVKVATMDLVVCVTVPRGTTNSTYEQGEVQPDSRGVRCEIFYICLYVCMLRCRCAHVQSYSDVYFRLLCVGGCGSTLA